jgi:arylsulfatase A-like enzyme
MDIGLAAWGLVGMQAAAAPPPHNVLVIVLDDVGVELVGAYDAHYRSLGVPATSPGLTPAIDGLLAQQGVLFSQAWSCPLCSPSRAAALTGRMPSSTGLGRYIRRTGGAQEPGLSSSATLLPQVLESAPTPYSSAAVGKWHLAGPAQVTLEPRHALGQPLGTWFDHYAGSLFGMQTEPALPPLATGYFSWDKLVATDVLPIAANCSSAPCFERPSVPPIRHYAPVTTANDALAFMAQLPQPWFVWVGFDSIHTPLHDAPAGAPLAYCQGYLPPPYCDTSSDPAPQSKARCMLEAVDSQIARLVCAANVSNTTIVLMSDNGGEGFSVLPPYDATHCKGTVYEGGVRVPLIVRSPSIAPELRGSVNDALVHVADVFGTVCELARVAPPNDPEIESVSFAPQLKGDMTNARDTLYTEGFFPNFEPLAGGPPPGYVGQRHLQAVRNARFKLIRRHFRTASGIEVKEELYDLAAGGPPNAAGQPTPDHFERHDLLEAGQPVKPEAGAAYAELSALLNARPSVVQ